MKHRPILCECGRGPKEYSKSAREGQRRLAGCRYCNDLDGRSRQERDVISLLRAVRGGVTVEAVSMETRRKYNTAQTQLIRMAKKGKVRSVSSDWDAPWDASAEREYYLMPLHGRGSR